ncbi:MAG: exo-alpha-sialidase [Planctomycetes bacterium]|nr:exo-alpha-sialidase [Planctomycetota bacterium]
MHQASLLAPVVLLATLAAQSPEPLRWLDLDGDTARQVTVRREAGKYLGHPTTVLLPDGKTILCVHPEGHGKGPIVLQRSSDGGRTWSGPLPVPENWATSLETPTIHRIVDRAAKARLVLFSGLHPIRSSISTDEGATWTPLAPIGDFGGIVAMASVVALANGTHAAFFHDDGRMFRPGGKRSQFTVYQTISADGGLTWQSPTVVWTGTDLDLCEPGVVRSPDGKRLAMLLRENSRKRGAHLCISTDEAVTWSTPRELPPVLCGDRHVGGYGPDGRLLLSFRDMSPTSPTRGDWVAWVGTFDDLDAGRDGQYRVRLARNWRGTDCAYPGVEVLPDGTFVATTYGHWEPGQSPFVRSVLLRLDELDALAQRPAPTFDRPSEAVVPVARAGKWAQRHEADIAKAKKGNHRIVFLGDSITEGWNGAGKEVWEDTWAPRQVLNAGVGGDRTQHVLWRLDNGLLEALAGNGNDVRAVVVMIGTNNSNGADHPASEIADGIVAVVQRLRRGLPTTKVLLLAVFPRGERPNAQRDKCATASRLAFATLAGDAMVQCRDLGPTFLGTDGTIAKDMMPDQLHLSPVAYRRWADAMLADLDAMAK